MYIFRQQPSKRKNRGRVTIVGKFHDGALYLAASKNHSKLDNFNKEEGRWRALERLIKGEFVSVYPMDHCDGKTFLSHALTLSKLIGNGTLKPVMMSGLQRVFHLKDFLDSPIVPKEKKEAYLKHQNDALANVADNVPAAE